ncbi:hypothetical protein TWF730_004783 [Orbilia blumenaviensis]|uniref:Uncharacterized protein n=1 Tax=Orbilia blumenaviensis TaxID=1796055 RepID=A0AAV9TWC5_9PEZI
MARCRSALRAKTDPPGWNCRPTGIRVLFLATSFHLSVTITSIIIIIIVITVS